MLNHIITNCHGERDALLMLSPALAYVFMWLRAHLKKNEKCVDGDHIVD